MLDIPKKPKEHDPTAEFIITINLDAYGEESSSPFKTKNRHTVRKVLRVACVTLEMPEEDRDRSVKVHHYALCIESDYSAELVSTSMTAMLLNILCARKSVRLESVA